MLELAILIPRVPLSALSCESFSLSDFFPFSVLRTRRLCCDDREQRALFAPNQLRTDRCYRKKKTMDAPLHPWALRIGSLRFSEQGSASGVSSCLTIVSSYRIRLLLSPPRKKPPWLWLVELVPEKTCCPSQPIGLRWRTYGCLLLWGELQARAARGLGILTSKIRWKTFISSSLLAP